MFDKDTVDREISSTVREIVDSAEYSDDLSEIKKRLVDYIEQQYQQGFRDGRQDYRFGPGGSADDNVSW